MFISREKTGLKIYFEVPFNIKLLAREFKERVSADCAKMKGWRSRQRASFNVKVHTTVVLCSIKVRHGYVCVWTAANASLWTTLRIIHVMDGYHHVILGLFQGSVN